MNDTTKDPNPDGAVCKEPEPIVKNTCAHTDPQHATADTTSEEVADAGASSGDEPLVEMGDIDTYVDDASESDIPVTDPAAREPPNPQTRGFFGQVVSRRHPLLIALMMVFAFGLAVAPFFFQYQKSAMSDALSIYRKACQGVTTGRITDDWMKSVSGPDLLRMTSDDRAAFFQRLECVDLNQYKTALRPLKGRQFGPKRAYVLSIHQGKDVAKAEKSGLPVINLFFPVVEDVLKIDVMPVVQ